MVKVVCREGEDIDSLMARFKRQVKQSGTLDECRKREFYLKKSLKRKAKSKLHMQKVKSNKKALAKVNNNKK